jgi:hypothetical protein
MFNGCCFEVNGQHFSYEQEFPNEKGALLRKINCYVLSEEVFQFCGSLKCLVGRNPGFRMLTATLAGAAKAAFEANNTNAARVVNVWNIII